MPAASAFPHGAHALSLAVFSGRLCWFESLKSGHGEGTEREGQWWPGCEAASWLMGTRTGWIAWSQVQVLVVAGQYVVGSMCKAAAMHG